MNNLYFKLLTKEEVGFYGTLASIGSLISYVYGGWNPTMTLLVILMGSDYATGVLASFKEGRGIKSSISFWGGIKKALMMLSILIAHYIDIVMNTNIVMVGSIYFWIGNELISLTENYGRLGLPMPDVIKDKIAILKGTKKEDTTSEQK